MQLSSFPNGAGWELACVWPAWSTDRAACPCRHTLSRSWKVWFLWRLYRHVHICKENFWTMGETSSSQFFAMFYPWTQQYINVMACMQENKFEQKGKIPFLFCAVTCACTLGMAYETYSLSSSHCNFGRRTKLSTCLTVEIWDGNEGGFVQIVGSSDW